MAEITYEQWVKEANQRNERRGETI
jgi:hypothetical protein